MSKSIKKHLDFVISFPFQRKTVKNLTAEYQKDTEDRHGRSTRKNAEENINNRNRIPRK